MIREKVELISRNYHTMYKRTVLIVARDESIFYWPVPGAATGDSGERGLDSIIGGGAGGCRILRQLRIWERAEL
jgi:hypothetical protein